MRLSEVVLSKVAVNIPPRKKGQVWRDDEGWHVILLEVDHSDTLMAYTIARYANDTLKMSVSPYSDNLDFLCGDDDTKWVLIGSVDKIEVA